MVSIIATPSANSTYTFSLDAAAQQRGSNVNFTYMGLPAMVAALETGAIDGFVGSSPFYATPVLNDTGVVWLNGPGGDYPAEFSLSNSITLNTMAAYAAENPDIVARMIGAIDDLGTAVEQRPDEVKAAIARLYPELDAAMLALILDTELQSFNTTPLTVEDMARAIAFVKLSGAELPELETLDPAETLLR